MKRNHFFACALATISLANITPVHAGFYLEGLQPFAGDYCADADPSLTDPLITGPIDWDTTSADATSLGGRLPYTAENCIASKGQAKPTYPPRIIRKPNHKPYSVPQK
ncbi:hypothetical protein KUV57_13050 [Epibacterium sp. DP7N7-1]|nr:hypothetical protein [Epibacterium sp. DP7N7-1]